jgi:hypothetical protein
MKTRNFDGWNAARRGGGQKCIFFAAGLPIFLFGGFCFLFPFSFVLLTRLLPLFLFGDFCFLFFFCTADTEERAGCLE